MISSDFSLFKTERERERETRHYRPSILNSFRTIQNPQRQRKTTPFLSHSHKKKKKKNPTEAHHSNIVSLSLLLISDISPSSRSHIHTIPLHHRPPPFLLRRRTSGEHSRATGLAQYQHH